MVAQQQTTQTPTPLAIVYQSGGQWMPLRVADGGTVERRRRIVRSVATKRTLRALPGGVERRQQAHGLGRPWHSQGLQGCGWTVTAPVQYRGVYHTVIMAYETASDGEGLYEEPGIWIGHDVPAPNEVSGDAGVEHPRAFLDAYDGTPSDVLRLLYAALKDLTREAARCSSNPFSAWPHHRDALASCIITYLDVLAAEGVQ